MFESCMAFRGRRFVASGLLVCLLSVGGVASPAQAYHRHHHHIWLGIHQHHTRTTSAMASRFAAIVVDANSGRVLYARNENDLRHPASITKVMTLYLLFEALEKGRLHLNSRLTISAHAAAQAPTKLGLAPGDTIDVDDAIKAVVTKSANDIAVAIAEALGGDEETFAAMMTREAHALGMTRTHYANASGLPNDEQITTAADLAILGRAIQERFPRYYHYFSTEAFDYDGVVNRNHNHLLGRIEGMDGIKTGYTRDSGFNLLTSVKRDGHFIVAVVMGGTTAASRDRTMANLIETEIDKGSTRRTAPMVAEVATERMEGRHDSESAKVAEETKPSGRPQPLPAEAAAEPVEVASITPAPVARPRPAFISGAPTSLGDTQIGAEPGMVKRVTFDGSTERPTTSTTTPSMLRWVVGSQPVGNRNDGTKSFAKAEPQAAEPQRAESPAREAAEPVVASDPLRPAAARSGWMIQIGATDDAAKAIELIARAKARKLSVLGEAKSFTEKVQKGSETLYRARFAGLDANDAEAACRSLKRSGFACFATKN